VTYYVSGGTLDTTHSVVSAVVNTASCFVAYKDTSLKIEELKKYEDSRLDKGVMPEESDTMLVIFARL